MGRTVVTDWEQGSGLFAPSLLPQRKPTQSRAEIRALEARDEQTRESVWTRVQDLPPQGFIAWAMDRRHRLDKELKDAREIGDEDTQSVLWATWDAIQSCLRYLAVYHPQDVHEFVDTAERESGQEDADILRRSLEWTDFFAQRVSVADDPVLERDDLLRVPPNLRASLYGPYSASRFEELQQLQTAQDDYTSKLVKYIPAESVALYFTLQGIIRSGIGEGSPNAWLWLIFGIGLVGTPLYLWRIAKVNNVIQLGVSTMAFIVWVFALGGAFESLPWYQPFIGSLVLVAFTFFVPLIAPVIPPFPRPRSPRNPG